jgi:hypothetical protein
MNREGAGQRRAVARRAAVRLAPGRPEYALQLRLVPPLPPSATWIEVLAAGRSAQVRARLTLRWGSSP